MPQFITLNLYSHHTDNVLLELLHQGEEGVFREIHFRYAKKLFNYARFRVRDTEDCKELVQEVFESLWKTESVIRELGPFLFTVLKFRIVNYYEHKAVEQRFSSYAVMFVEEVEIQEQEGEIAQLREVIDRSMKNLPQRCQDVLRLRIDEELSLDDIAVRLNVNKESVKRYLTMAMNYFRKEHSPLYKAR